VIEQIVAAAVAAHDGTLIDSRRSTVVAVFRGPADAIGASLDAQRASRGESVGPLGMAVHTGPVVLRGEGDYAGTTLEHTTRLLAVGHGGQVLVSSATVDRLSGRLPAGVSLIDLGDRLLSDLVGSERVWQLAHPDLAVEFPPLRSLETFAHNLPPQITPLVGRQEELVAVGRALDSDRMVTLTGTAGVGKTRLAVHAAAQRMDRHPDGVWLVELATLADPDGVASKVAGVLQVWETANRATVDAIVGLVGDRRILLVLDNCEHVVEACAGLVEGLLAGCGHLTILATSREPLSVPGEVTWQVPPLPAPPSGWREDLAGLSRFDAVRLFGDRARRARPDFALTEANAGAIADLCARLDGVPLALELAAARCRSLTPGQIDRQLDHRFRLLTGGARTRLPRQQTLEASVAWSHDLLSVEERVTFRRLGVFAGPFPLEAAEAVCGGDDLGSWAVFDALSHLVERSLVVHDPVGGWYRLLETVRLYALERCGDASEVEATRDRHAGWWAAWLNAHHPDGPSDGDLDAVHTAYPNLRAALQWAAATQPELALDLAGGLGIYWYLRGLLGDALTLGDLALANTHGPAWARAVGRMVMPRYYADDTRYMTSTVTEAVAVAAAAGDELTPLRCRAARTTDFDHLSDLQEVAAAADTCGDPWVAARLHMILAWWHVILDDPDASIELDRLAALAEQLDATAFRFGLQVIRAEQLAAYLDVGGAIDCLGQALTDADRASPTISLMAFANLAWYRQLRGQPGSVEDNAGLLAHSGRDWGARTSFASAMRQLPELLAGDVVWDGPKVKLPGVSPATLWLLVDAVGEDNVTLFPTGSSDIRADMAEFCDLVLSARTALRHERFREAEDAAATLIRRRCVDRHYWLLVMARCAADASSHLEAARLLGAVAGIQHRFGLPWLPRILVAARDATETLCRDGLGGNGFDIARTEGLELDLDAAIAYTLRARGERKRPTSGWDSLTPTELQVAEQVAAGMTNAQIAATLLMGRTTVKTHLSHIFTKLGCTNRADLAAQAARRTSSPVEPASSPSH
jgi:predicted ATPase/DNA-binding CsgD family transcriptional regulator